MAYTEIKERNGNKYYYRVLSIREGNKISKKRNYLGKNLSKKIRSKEEKIADGKFEGLKKKRNFDKLKNKIVEILKKNKIKRAGIFGSYARGEENEKSDIDILIQPTKKIGFGFVGVQIQLEDKLKKKVDLLTYKSLNPLIKDEILKEEIRII